MEVATAMLCQYSREVEEFCRIHSIREHLDIATRLAKEVFNSETTLTKDCDRETGEEWVTIHVAVIGKTWEQVLHSYNNYVDKFVDLVASDRRHLICLSYDVS